ncbi:MAG: hypothetical protein RPU34_04370 [Candidatus Sedimenticola sp. (ex Thyasira tokunagai)]
MNHQSPPVKPMPLRGRAVYLDPRTHSLFKKAANNGGYSSMQAAAEEAVTDWLDKKEKENTQ